MTGLSRTVAIVDPLAARYAAALTGEHPSLVIEPFAHIDELLARDEVAARAEALVTMGIGLRTQHLDALPALRWVQSLLAGVDALLAPLSRRPEVVLTSLRGAHGPQMSEMVLTHMLVLAKDVPRMVRQRDERTWQPWTPRGLQGKVAGIVGLGASGRAVARMANAVGLQVIGVSSHAVAEEALDECYGYDALTDVAARVDFLVVVCALTPETTGLIGEAVLSAMRPSSYLINVSRGAVVDEDALVDALGRGAIAGAGVDVTRTEPLPADSRLWELDNVFITPHLAGRSDAYVEQALPILRANMRSFAADDLAHAINRVGVTG